MFVPAVNRLEDADEIRSLVAQARTAQFVTVDGDGVPTATLLPIIWRGDVVFAHMARANKQWRDLGTASPCLLICSGPEAYISPSWYATKAEHGRVVPTWNYSAVHLIGTVSVHQDRDRLRDIVGGLTDTHEHGRVQPWGLTDAPDRFIEGQLGGIVGLEVTVTRVEAKVKYSQNRSAEDRRGVVDGLRGENLSQATEIADAMEAHL